MYKDQPVKISLLLDFYGDILSPKQQEAMELFYNNDFSLSEISDNTGITRQGIRDRIQKAEGILVELESKLHLVERFGNAKEDLEYIITRIEQVSEQTGLDLSDIVKTAEKLL